MRDKIEKEIVSWIKSIVIAFIIAFVCREVLLTPSTVFGESMSPTFQDKDRIIFSKISHIERFDIIIFNAPGGCVNNFV